MKVKLGEVSVLINGDRGKNYPSQADILSDGDVPFVNAGHLNGRNIRLDEMSYITFEKYNQLRSGKFCKGDILYCLRGSLGKKAVVQDIVEGAIASSLVIIRPDSQMIDVNYLMLALDSPSIQNQLLKANNGSSQPNLSAASVQAYEIDLPNKEVQEEIANKFSKIQMVIDAHKQQLQKLDELVKSRFVEMFGKIEHEDSLENLCRFIDYRGKTPEKTDMGLPFITAKNVRMHHMSFETQEFISKETYDKVMTRGFPRVGDVVFTTEAPLGNVCRIPSIDTEFYIGQRIITMQTDSLEPAYLEYALASNEFRKKLNAKASGSTVTGIRSKLLEKLTIPVPPLELQNRFAAFVSEVGKSKLAVKQSLEKLETLKKSLMQQYFG